MTSFGVFFGLAVIAACGLLVFGIMTGRGQGPMDQRASYFVYAVLGLFLVAFVVLALLSR